MWVLFCFSYFVGIDASINPGLALPDSIGAGLESLLPASATVVPGREKDKEKEALRCFGAMGSLAAVSTVTSAVKSLANGDNMNTTGTSTLAEGRDTVNAATATATGGNSVYANNSYAPSIDGRLNLDPYVSVNKSIKLAGYSGLMLPVMEDVVLAQRAAEGRFSFRDLLTFSAVCGVGLDTVPVPGDTSEEVLAGVYMETATMAFRLNKPLSCRVLPQQGKVAGDVTDVASPYLCNTTVFSIP